MMAIKNVRRKSACTCYGSQLCAVQADLVDFATALQLTSIEELLSNQERNFIGLEVKATSKCTSHYQG